MAESASQLSTRPPPAGQASDAAGVRPSGLVRLALPASMVMSFLAASSAPTPLYATYAGEWHFSPITTTVIFGAYAIAVLLALLVLGRVSDHAGRRPVLLAALAVQVLATVVLATAGGAGALLAGRVLQGLATGGALGALGAAMLDVDPARGALANAAAPGVGTGVGSLMSGLLVQYVPAPAHVVYLVLIGVFVLQGIGVAVSPETSARKPGLRAALVPELAVPRGTRAPVLAAAPILLAVWALSGLYGSLGPALARQLSGSASAVTGALAFFLLAVTASLTAVALRRVPPRTVMLCGIAATAAAAAGTLAAVEESSAAGFFASTVVAGIGFGAGLQGAFRTVIPLAPPRERAGVLSVLYIVSYCGMGVPAIAAGILVVHGGGLISSARDYALVLIVLAVAALAGLLSTTRSERPARAAGPPAMQAILDNSLTTRLARLKERPSRLRRKSGISRPANAVNVREANLTGPKTTNLQEETTVIFHINRLTFKSGLSQEQRQAGLGLLRQAGEANPAVRSYVVGPDLGGEFEWGAVYVLEDLNGYWEYLTHPAHVHSEMSGMELISRFEAFDVTDSDDPGIGDKIAKLQARNYQEHPELAALVAQVPSFTVPDGEASQR